MPQSHGQTAPFFEETAWPFGPTAPLAALGRALGPSAARPLEALGAFQAEATAALRRWRQVDRERVRLAVEVGFDWSNWDRRVSKPSVVDPILEFLGVKTVLGSHLGKCSVFFTAHFFENSCFSGWIEADVHWGDAKFGISTHGPLAFSASSALQINRQNGVAHGGNVHFLWPQK